MKRLHVTPGGIRSPDPGSAEVYTALARGQTRNSAGGESSGATPFGVWLVASPTGFEPVKDNRFFSPKVAGFGTV